MEPHDDRCESPRLNQFESLSQRVAALAPAELALPRVVERSRTRPTWVLLTVAMVAVSVLLVGAVMVGSHHRAATDAVAGGEDATAVVGAPASTPSSVLSRGAGPIDRLLALGPTTTVPGDSGAAVAPTTTSPQIESTSPAARSAVRRSSDGRHDHAGAEHDELGAVHGDGNDHDHDHDAVQPAHHHHRGSPPRPVPRHRRVRHRRRLELGAGGHPRSPPLVDRLDRRPGRAPHRDRAGWNGAEVRRTARVPHVDLRRSPRACPVPLRHGHRLPGPGDRRIRVVPAAVRRAVATGRCARRHHLGRR